jgi:hypothetical protein
VASTATTTTATTTATITTTMTKAAITTTGSRLPPIGARRPPSPRKRKICFLVFCQKKTHFNSVPPATIKVPSLPTQSTHSLPTHLFFFVPLSCTAMTTMAGIRTNMGKDARMDTTNTKFVFGV